MDRRIAAGLRAAGIERRVSRNASRSRSRSGGNGSTPELSEVEDAGLLTGRRATRKATGGR